MVLFTASPLAPAPAHVTRDPSQPRFIRRFVAQLVCVSPRLDERFLGQVLSYVRIAYPLGTPADNVGALCQECLLQVEVGIYVWVSIHVLPVS